MHVKEYNENKDLIISKLTSIQKNLINRSSNAKGYYKLKTWSIILFVASLRKSVKICFSTEEIEVPPSLIRFATQVSRDISL